MNSQLILCFFVVLIKTHRCITSDANGQKIDELYTLMHQLNATVIHHDNIIKMEYTTLQQLLSDTQSFSQAKDTNISVKLVQQETLNRDLNSTIHQLVEREKTMNSTVKKLQQIITNQGQEIEHLKSIKGTVQNQSPTVAFYARWTKSEYFTGQIVHFDDVVTNIGNGYNKYTGVFTVPTTGLYFLSASLMSVQGNRLYSVIMKNGAYLASLYAGEQGHDSNTQTIPLELHRGDTLYVGTMSQTDRVNMEGYSYFSGFLVKSI